MNEVAPTGVATGVAVAMPLTAPQVKTNGGKDVSNFMKRLNRNVLLG